MQGIKNTLSALLASLKPKSDQLEIETYYQNSCGLSEEEIYNIVECLTEAFLEAGYQGKGYLIFDQGNQNIQDLTLMAVLREEPMFLYRLGITPSETQAGVKWQLEAQHPSLRLYQLVSDEME
jgi:hypothetical protein